MCSLVIIICLRVHNVLNICHLECFRPFFQIDYSVARSLIHKSKHVVVVVVVDRIKNQCIDFGYYCIFPIDHCDSADGIFFECHCLLFDCFFFLFFFFCFGQPKILNQWKNRIHNIKSFCKHQMVINTLWVCSAQCCTRRHRLITGINVM